VAVLAAVTVRPIATVLLRLPDLPVMVTVDVPMGAEPVAASERTQLAVVAPALNDSTTPLGRPEMLNVTVPVKPFCAAKVSVLLPVAPRWTLKAAGEADKVNVAAGVMVSAMVVLLVPVLAVPVTVTVAPTAAAALAAVKVTALVRPWVIGLKVAVTPKGNPDADSATVLLKPFRALTATVLAPLPPALRVTLAGIAERVKLAGAVTVMARVALLVDVPDVPAMVTVEVPYAALAAAFSVSVVTRAAVKAGLNVAVTPTGKPVMAKATMPLKLPCGATVMVLAALPPWEILRLAGDGVIE
jgi:hypothetical protein